MPVAGIQPRATVQARFGISWAKRWLIHRSSPVMVGHPGQPVVVWQTAVYSALGMVLAVPMCTVTPENIHLQYTVYTDSTHQCPHWHLSTVCVIVTTGTGSTEWNGRQEQHSYVYWQCSHHLCINTYLGHFWNHFHRFRHYHHSIQHDINDFRSHIICRFWFYFNRFSDEPPLYPAPIYAILWRSIYLCLTSIHHHTTLPAN